MDMYLNIPDMQLQDEGTARDMLPDLNRKRNVQVFCL